MTTSSTNSESFDERDNRRLIPPAEIASTFTTEKISGASVSIITIMEICKAPTLRLKALNKHSVIHKMYIEMEMYIQEEKGNT